MAAKKNNTKTNDETTQTKVVAVIGDDTSVPTVEVEKTELEPALEATAVVPNVVKEINQKVVDAADAPQVLTTKSKNAKRVQVIFDGHLGSKLLKKYDITDDAEYVDLLKTERGKTLVREV